MAAFPAALLPGLFRAGPSRRDGPGTGLRVGGWGQCGQVGVAAGGPEAAPLFLPRRRRQARESWLPAEVAPLPLKPPEAAPPIDGASAGSALSALGPQLGRLFLDQPEAAFGATARLLHEHVYLGDSTDWVSAGGRRAAAAPRSPAGLLLTRRPLSSAEESRRRLRDDPPSSRPGRPDARRQVKCFWRAERRGRLRDLLSAIEPTSLSRPRHGTKGRWASPVAPAGGLAGRRVTGGCSVVPFQCRAASLRRGLAVPRLAVRAAPEAGGPVAPRGPGRAAATPVLRRDPHGRGLGLAA